MSQNLFEPVGAKSQVSICVDLLKSLAEKDPISEAVVLNELEAQTGSAPSRAVALAAMREATERLHRRGVPGAEKVDGGWVRLDPAGMMRYCDDRDRRASRQLTRRAVGAQVADPERLTGADRLRRDFYINVAQRVSEITARRARRLRPINGRNIESA